MNQKELVIMGETEHDVLYDSIEERNDKLAMLPREVRRSINFGKSLGAQSADPMAGGYASHVIIQDGDALPNVYNTPAALLVLMNAVAVGQTIRLWEHTILPRYLKVWGNGLYGTINNQGYAYFLVGEIAVLFGVNLVALKVESYDRMRQRTVMSFNDSATHLGDFTTLITATPTNNQAGMLAIPQTTVIAAPYSRLAIDVKAIVIDAADADFDMIAFRLPTTVKSS